MTSRLGNTRLHLGALLAGGRTTRKSSTSATIISRFSTLDFDFVPKPSLFMKPSTRDELRYECAFYPRAPANARSLPRPGPSFDQGE